MITHKSSAQTSDAIHHPARVASLAWLVILAIAVIGGSLTLSCVTPFAALAVALAGTVTFRAALTTMTAIWFANQLVGFSFLGFPRTASVVAEGLVLGVAALVATVVAFAILRRASSWTAPAHLGLALLISFAAFEAFLLSSSLLFGNIEMFAPPIVAQIAFTNVAWFVVIIALNELVPALYRPWFGVTPRLVRA